MDGESKGPNRLGDFVLGVLAAALSVFVLPVGLVLYPAGLILARRCQRPFIVAGMLAAVFVPLTIVGACVAVYGGPPYPHR